jgi:protein-disulfide isomerase
MRKIWLGLAALCLAVPVFGAFSQARAEDAAPAPTAEDRVLGKSDAPVTIIEYASLTCPHCAEFDRETLPKIKENWIETGKAKLIFRDFPLDGTALRAAMVARCAPPERYFAFVDTLFQSQTTWARNDWEPALSRIAKLGGMSDDQFKKCLTDEALGNAIVASRATATDSYKVESTPTFFINGTRFVGAQPYEAFDKALTAALPKS